MNDNEELNNLKNVLFHIRARVELSYKYIIEHEPDRDMISKINLKNAIELMGDYGKTDTRIKLDGNTVE